MAKRIPLPCTPANCGELFPICGVYNTYTNRKCRCDTCHAANFEYKTRHYLKNRGTYIERSNKHYAENRETKIKYQRQHYAANREAKLEYQSRYRLENLEAIAERDKRWREANREAISEQKKRYYAENSAATIERARQWALANPERAREQSRLGTQRRNARIKATKVVDFTVDQLEQRLAYYGHSCYIKLSGVCTGAFDEIDHVKPLSKGGPHMLANLRPACKPCNSRKAAKWPFKQV